MKKEIIKQLEIERPDFWKLEQADVERNNIYFEKNEEESFISGKRTDYLVTVYKKMGNKLGESAVTIKEGDDIRKKVKEAIVAAKLIKNSCYVPFEKFDKYPELRKSRDLPSCEELRKRIKECYEEIKKTDAKLNAFEVFTKKSRAAVTTSIGQELSEEYNGAYAECVITIKGKRGEMEYLPMRQESLLEQIDLKEFVKSNYHIAKDISNSSSPKTFKGNVILTGDALGEFFITSPNDNPAVIHSSARMKFMNLSRFEIGKPIEKEILGDKITIKSNPLIEDGARSSGFDSNLVPARELILIENGIFRNFLASKRYADYLKIRPTGPVGNVEVGLGKTPAGEFYKDGNCEIVSFSWFSPSIYSGDFTAEVRLGYFIKDGKKIPFKGGMLVGNYFKLLANCILSREKWFKSGYYGPKAIMFMDCLVSGS
jgi:predicted Zn-dependent protease